jgi:hypothetical protein
MDLFEQPAGSRQKPLTVSDVTARVRAAIERDVGRVWVLGELSNFRVAGSGHGYGTLKDDRSQLRLVAFGTPSASPASRPDGMTLLARGVVGVYEARGEYQMVVESWRVGRAPPPRRCGASTSGSGRRGSSTRRASGRFPSCPGGSAWPPRPRARRSVTCCTCSTGATRTFT